MVKISQILTKYLENCPTDKIFNTILKANNQNKPKNVGRQTDSAAPGKH